MEKRQLGRTGHLSTLAIFGAAALSDVTQAQADLAMEQVLAAGVNHIDVAPSYGQAESRIGPWMPEYREKFFLGCKTMERSRAGAFAEMRASLKRLQVDSFDLYQLHAVTNLADLDACTAPGGALTAIIEARQQGLTRFAGITGHGNRSPEVFLAALQRYDFDTVMLAVNPAQFAIPAYREHAQALIETCRKKDVGLMVIKSIAKQPWGERNRHYSTWYEPFDQPDQIQQGVDFALSHDVTALCTAGDVRILPMFLEACENFTEMHPQDRARLIDASAQDESIFHAFDA